MAGKASPSGPDDADMADKSAVTARASGPLRGAIAAPGDKSISHRALIFGALAKGETRIVDILEADDVRRTGAALRMLGASVEREPGDDGASNWRVVGAPWRRPARPLYFGNAGTGARLMMGAIAGAGVAARFDGDQSLRQRPMARILDPLRAMGVEAAANESRLPVEMSAGPLKAIDYQLPVPSAQIKSAIILAALGAEGQTTIHEPVPCRDHTERMLPAFGGRITVEEQNGGRLIRIDGGQHLSGTTVRVPGDPSSAAFPIVAALITPGSDVTVENVLLNPTRAGLIKTLLEMGADIVIENSCEASGERVGDIRARYSELSGVTVPAQRAASMIDEYPILAVAASFAKGTTRMEGLGELRVKESDRLASVEAGLLANGVQMATGQDWLEVKGDGAPAKGGGVVFTHMDHRIAMSFLVMGLGAKEPVSIDDAAMIATSYPRFNQAMRQLGADL